MFVIKYKNIFLAISMLIVGAAILATIILGVRIGIDFKGGSQLEVSYPEIRPEQVTIETTVAKLGLTPVHVQSVGEKGYSIKTQAISETQHEALVAALTLNGSKAEEVSFNSIGPSVGTELNRKALIAVVVVIIWNVLYIAFAFRKVSQPVASWKYGIIAIVTLVHDIAIPTGLFAVLGKIQGTELDVLFVTALLTVLGLSVSDTIVVFDRIRENIKKHHGDAFESIVGRSIKETFTRSISTSLTVILALLALFLFGPTTTKDFALVLITGMFFGTYSSIFVASPLLVTLEKWQARKKK
jgi:preprotein translocase subunit SecF